MNVKYNLKGKERKALAEAVGEILGAEVKYAGAPTFAYIVDGYTIDKDGTLTRAKEDLIKALAEKGFTGEVEKMAFEVDIPKKYFEPEALERLQNIVTAKGKLIAKALGVEKIEVIITEDKVCFPWYKEPSSPEEMDAYVRFNEAVVNLVKKQKRILDKEHETENEKYAFRCFLLRLGFIGDEYKNARKILLKNLTGNSAFLKGATK
jgi:hypothetical protein